MKRRKTPILTALILVVSLLIPNAATLVSADDGETVTTTAAVNFPAAYDLRDVDGKCYTTPVRSQAPFGTCWSFATVAALESSVLAAGLNGADGKAATPETLDLSEKQIAWFSAMPLRDPNSSQNGEGQYIADFISEDALVEFMNRGGNEFYSTSTLAQGIGPAHESDDAFLGYHGKDAIIDHTWKDGKFEGYSYSASDDWRIPDEYRFVSDYSIREVRFLPAPFTSSEDVPYKYNEDATNAIKSELMQHRAVQVNFCADVSMPGQEGNAQYLSENWAHYTYIPAGSNHAVTIIGWDDSYSKSNFIQGSVEFTLANGDKKTVDKAPPADGAWLVKNSWGSGENEFPDKGSASWGITDGNGVHTGYFWLSYYDQSINGPVSYIVEQADDRIDNIDQYDYMQIGTNDSYLSDSEMKMANAFMAEHSEAIEDVSCMTSYPGMTVKYEIYLLTPTTDKAAEGLKVAEKSATYEYAGFHKESLSSFDILLDTSGTGSNELIVPKYQRYSVVVTQTTKEGKYALNFQYADFTEGGGLSSFKGILNERESWYEKDGEWKDYASDEDFRHELARETYKKITGEENVDTFTESVTYDNFPIKAFTRRLDKDCIMFVKGNDSLYYKTDNYASSVMKVDIHSTASDLPDITPDDIVWGTDKNGAECVTIDVTKDPTAVKFTALDADDKSTVAYVTVKGVGTVPFYVYVHKVVITDIVFPPDADTGNAKHVFVYTGEEITPAIGVNCTQQKLVKDVDYEFIYKDNVKCGLATVFAEKRSDRVGDVIPENVARDSFVIVPQKASVKSVTPGEGMLNVKLKDQSECGLTGYRVEYREEGETEWREVTVKAPETSVEITGLMGETSYEVRVSGYVEIPEDAMWYSDHILYGEASESVKAVTEYAPASESESADSAADADRSSESGGSSFNKLPVIIGACAVAALILIAAVVAALKGKKKKNSAPEEETKPEAAEGEQPDSKTPEEDDANTETETETENKTKPEE